MHPLFLNVSDLKGHETELFTSSFRECVPPHLRYNCDLANYTVPLLYVRLHLNGWLRGRYRDFPENSLDEILTAFPANPGQDPTINGGQFFAIFRYILDTYGPKRVGQEKTRNITPNDYILPIETIDNIISKESKSLRVMIQRFLKDPERRIWNPPACSSDREFLARLRLPTYPDGGPCLLLHNLDACDEDIVNDVIGEGPVVCICNTSGSGKTRRMLEVLTKKWGFYFVSAPDVNGVGVRDLLGAIDGVKEYNEWVADLNVLPREEWAGQSKVNSHIASKLLKKVLAARIVLFKMFLELAIEVDGRLQHKHKRIWLLFQLFDRDDSPFLSIKKCLDKASTDALDELLERLHSIRTTYFPEESLILGLDEAQHAVQSYPHPFVSSKDETKPRSFLREVVRVFSELPAKLVVSGTGVSMEDLNIAMSSGVSKSDRGEKWLLDLGMFDTWPKLEAFLNLYLPASYLNTSSGYHLQQRLREYLLGRYRFSVTFLEYLLLNGLRSPHRLLNEYIKQHTTCFPGDCGEAFTKDEPELGVRVVARGFEWSRLEKDKVALQHAAMIVQSHLTKGQTPTFGPVTVKLVEYGIAHLRNNHSGEIVEPLAFLSLVKWFETQPTLSLETNIGTQLGIGDSSRGDAYEQLAILYLLRALDHFTTLRTVFKFHNTEPSWADEPTRIVGHINGAPVPVDVLGKNPENPGLGVVQYAANIKEVIQWIKNPTTAVLVPSTLFGPDVLLSCNGVLLMGQLKSCTVGNLHSLDSETICDALTSLHPNHWFKKAEDKDRQELVNAIHQRRVLRFVGGYPLPPDLNLRARSVRRTLAEFAPDVALATINLDHFRSQFYSGDQASILAPMDHALQRRRREAA